VLKPNAAWLVSAQVYVSSLPQPDAANESPPILVTLMSSSGHLKSYDARFRRIPALLEHPKITRRPTKDMRTFRLVEAGCISLMVVDAIRIHQLRSKV
jgi:hypothetical protein